MSAEVKEMKEWAAEQEDMREEELRELVSRCA